MKNCIEVEYSLDIDGHCEMLETTYWQYPKKQFNLADRPLYRNGVIYGFLTALGYDANEEMDTLIHSLPGNNKVSKTFLPAWESDGHTESV